ncbi:pyridoxamine 5'-phosphate oxidase family protein [Halocalculus aciditolerans]|uniref:PPOX class F420-dependent enzyme n=1 Tax=Halocalculus aciditolerans TaxID=1383812 RepID=A0A830FKQ9_9EURY|nr:PPOX class F420-dependent oxidoreductase [Halocalculus aciditolerans]GGL56003.1 PPOX class F420-dependent enzyme [Halocalculus aciditolerans]
MSETDDASEEAVPREFRDFFEKETYAHVTTLNADGSPHTTPVWVDYDADANRLLVNTERHRRKAKNVERDPRVSVSMTDPDTPYRFLSVTGEVDEVTTDGAREHIDELARRYTGDDYATPIQSERVLLRIRPEEVLTGG